MNPTKPDSILKALSLLSSIPTEHFWVNYDHGADVLYISFQRPQKATGSEMTDDGYLLRYRDEKLVGITILDASTRNNEQGITIQNWRR